MSHFLVRYAVYRPYLSTRKASLVLLLDKGFRVIPASDLLALPEGSSLELKDGLLRLPGSRETLDQELSARLPGVALLELQDLAAAPLTVRMERVIEGRVVETELRRFAPSGYELGFCLTAGSQGVFRHRLPRGTSPVVGDSLRLDYDERGVAASVETLQ